MAKKRQRQDFRDFDMDEFLDSEDDEMAGGFDPIPKRGPKRKLSGGPEEEGKNTRNKVRAKRKQKANQRESALDFPKGRSKDDDDGGVDIFTD